MFETNNYYVDHRIDVDYNNRFFGKVHNWVATYFGNKTLLW